jgi:hypothetical protein
VIGIVIFERYCHAIVVDAQGGVSGASDASGTNKQKDERRRLFRAAFLTNRVVELRPNAFYRPGTLV